MTTSTTAASRGTQTAETVTARRARAEAKAARQAANGVNPRFTTTWKDAGKTDTEYMSGARRFILNAGTRAGTTSDPELMLRELEALHEQVEQAILIAIVEWRHAGYSWAAIGEAKGVTKVAARARWADAVAAFEAAGGSTTRGNAA